MQGLAATSRMLGRVQNAIARGNATDLQSALSYIKRSRDPHWVPLLRGKIALWGVPSKQQLKIGMREQALSVVITLQAPREKVQTVAHTREPVAV